MASGRLEVHGKGCVATRNPALLMASDGRCRKSSAFLSRLHWLQEERLRQSFVEALKWSGVG
jgi:hypothetical protein